MAEKPHITIGITCYNAQATLAAAIESALVQDWNNKEIVIVDDASTDSSRNIMDQYPGLRIIAHPINAGVAAARNAIIAAAEGEFIAFFDDDDVSAPDRLTQQYTQLIACENAHPEKAVLCHSARRQVDDKNHQRYRGAPEGGGKIARDFLTGQSIASPATCGQMARTQVYRNLGGFDETFRRSEDTDLAIRHALAGGIFAGVAEPLVTQYKTGGTDKSVEQECYYFGRLLLKHAALANDGGFGLQWLPVKQALAECRYDRVVLLSAPLVLRHPWQSWKRLKAAWHRAFL